MTELIYGYPLETHRAVEKVVATLQGGYLLTDDDVIWAEYLDGRQIDAKRILGVTHKQKKMLTDGRGQGVLFKGPVGCGLG